jgi:hypothetical protein
MTIVDYKYYQILKYDSFGNNITTIPKRHIKSIDSLEVTGTGRSLNGSFVADAKVIGINPFDIIQIRVSETPSFLVNSVAIYRGQYIVLGNKKKPSLSQFQTIGLEDSLKYIKPTYRVYGTEGVLTDVADIFSSIAASLISIQRPSNTTSLYANLYKYDPINFPLSGVSVETVSLITESYYDLFEYCKQLTGDLNYEWGLDTEGFLFFRPAVSNETIPVDEETQIEWKDINCASHINTIDFYMPTNNDTDAIEYRVIDQNALTVNGDLKYPERRKTYLLSSDLLTKVTFTNQYYGDGNQSLPIFDPNVANVDVIAANPTNTHNQFRMFSPYLPSPSFLLDPQLALTLTDSKADSYFAYPIYNNVGPFTVLNPINTSGQWRWQFGALAAKTILAINAHIEFETDATNLNPSAFNEPDGSYKKPYFGAIFARKGSFDTITAYVSFTVSNSGSTIKITKIDPIPKFDNKIYSANIDINNPSLYEGLLITNRGNANFIKIKVFEFAMYTVDINLLEKIAKALFKEVPEDPGTIFLNKLIINPTTNLTFNYEDENFTLQGITRKALIYRYSIKGDNYLTTEIEIEQAYAANDEQQAQIIIDRDTTVKNYTVSRKRAVA